MNHNQPSNWDIFKTLCAVLGDQDKQPLAEAAAQQRLPLLFNMAQEQDLLPALAYRCNQQTINRQALDEPKWDALKQALMGNTLRNMKVSAQALKLARQLNQAGIIPLFLKGTAQLLTKQSDQLGFRKQVDIDFLVEPQQLEAAADILLEDGYRYYPMDKRQSGFQDTRSAMKASAAHHHLPPLAKNGYASTVELHRHFLPRRFQSKNPLTSLFRTATSQESHGAQFLVPSPEYQMIHLVLGKLIHDGHLARRTLPIREACDYITVLENSGGHLNQAQIEKHCGKHFATFTQLVRELMAYSPKQANPKTKDITKRLQTMQRRYNSPAIGILLNSYARTLYLTQSLIHSPAKLPTYLRRLRET